MKTNGNSNANDLPGETINNILLTGNWMNEIFSDHLKQYALSIQQYQVLRSLKALQGEPADLQTLSAEMMSKNSNTTRLVEKLRLKGLITRNQNEENRRKVDIRITEAGLNLLEEINNTQSEFENTAVKNLDSSEMQLLNKLLLKIRNK